MPGNMSFHEVNICMIPNDQIDFLISLQVRKLHDAIKDRAA
jgi:hypothetical protein